MRLPYVENLTQALRPLALCWVWTMGSRGRRPEAEERGCRSLLILTPSWVVSGQGHGQPSLELLPTLCLHGSTNSSPPLLALPTPLTLTLHSAVYAIQFYIALSLCQSVVYLHLQPWEKVLEADWERSAEEGHPSPLLTHRVRGASWAGDS